VVRITESCPTAMASWSSRKSTAVRSGAGGDLARRQLLPKSSLMTM
jgi:hypothetical protein